MMKTILTVALLAFAAVAVNAQTDEFTYQGTLNISGSPANGNYDFEFRLFDAAEGGAQVGSTVARTGITVTDGVFNVSLSFAGAFPGANRWLEIWVRPAGGAGYQTLAPRTLLTSAPYAIRSQAAETAGTATTANNALSLGGVAANQYVQTTDPRMTDARPPTSGSGNYIQNRTTVQGLSNFNISGNGVLGGNLTTGGVVKGDAVDSAMGYTFNGNRFVGYTATGNTYLGFVAGNTNSGSNNTFAGFGSGAFNTASDNTFFGSAAGQLNTTGNDNSFFGRTSGDANTTGNLNSFFGSASGSSNTEGSENSFFGTAAGIGNTTGSFNSYFGRGAGRTNTTGQGNSIFGFNAGRLSETSFNSFFGYLAGEATTTGSNNSFFGVNSGLVNTTGYLNSFFGQNTGLDNTSGHNNTFIGNGAGSGNTSGFFNTFVGRVAGDDNTTGTLNTAIGYNANVSVGNLTYATAIGAGSLVSTSNTIVLGRTADDVRIPGDLVVTDYTQLLGTTLLNGIVVVPQLDSAGSTNLCRNNLNRLATCSSSLRYKTNIGRYSSGLNLVKRLQPITFDWKDGGLNDLGLGAEDVAAVEPLLVTYNEKGQVEGVKYDRIGVVLVNVVKEQQSQIEALKTQIEEQRAITEGLRQLVCAQNASAAVCSPK